MKLKWTYSQKDLLQGKRKLKRPQIRVWVHPASGDDYYRTFRNLKAAIAFSNRSFRREPPLVAWRGREYGLFPGKPKGTVKVRVK